MHVANCEWAGFVVWTPKEMFVQRVARDWRFLEGIFPELKHFYFEHLLPALYAEHI